VGSFVAFFFGGVLVLAGAQGGRRANGASVDRVILMLALLCQEESRVFGVADCMCLIAGGILLDEARECILTGRKNENLPQINADERKYDGVE
jgi:hypothetical protein